MEWLIQYFSNPTRVTPIDTTSSVCLHGNLDLQKVQAVKAVNKEIADQLYKEAFKGDLKIKRLNQNSLCEMCVRNRCRTMILARSFTNDNRLINDLLKQTLDSQSILLIPVVLIILIMRTTGATNKKIVNYSSVRDCH